MLVVFELSVISRMNTVDWLFAANTVSSWQRFMWGKKSQTGLKLQDKREAEAL